MYSWQWLKIVAVAILAGFAAALLPFAPAAAAVIGIALALLTLVQPLVGIALVLLIGPLGAIESLWIGASLPKSGQLLFVATVGAWLGYGVLRRRIVLAKTAINIPLAIFITAVSISLLAASSLRLGIIELIKWLELALIMLIVVDIGTTWHRRNTRSAFSKINRPGIDLRWIAGILLLAGLSQAIIGIWQFGIRGSGPDHFLILDRFYRAFGTFQQPNPFGGFMGIAASLAIGITIGLVVDLFKKIKVGIGWRTSDWLWFIFVTSVAASTTVALIMSWSRGAWLGFAVGMATLIFFLPKPRLVGLLLLSLLFLFMLIAVQFNLIPTSITGRLSSFAGALDIRDVRGVYITVENFADVERLAHWQSGIDMARDNLAVGVGFGNYAAAYEDYGLLNWPHPLGHAHNYYLNLLAETGAIGLLAYLVLWIVIFIQAIKLLSTSKWVYRGVVLGLLAAWMALSVHHLVDKLYVNQLYLFVGVMLGLQQILALKDD
jgi:O-antigen ligase